ncbi:isochorismatase family protein [Hyphomicrobium sp. 99]|uniref:isochorismatase family protein n=1 Tax=Hyphomicrobium sp. 99 TaxID=1163419 RepID=UPI0005F7A827|nr:isochorismatase family protein [Hyphomicrobium sp. 99]
MNKLTVGDVYRGAGFGRSVRRGARPAVLVVDFSYGFTDPAYPTATDADGAINATTKLLASAREKGVPIAFTTISFEAGHIETLPWLRKSAGMASLKTGSRLVEIDERLLRQEREPIVVKLGASAFFGTNLQTLLASWRTDTLIVTGATTSGCVRASVVDGVQSGYDVLVPEECVADRAAAPHEANLFDIRQKYADVISLGETLEYLGSLGGREK